MFGGAAAAGAAQQFEQEDFGGAAAGRDVTGTVIDHAAEVLTGTSRRVHLPTGKEIDAKIPPGLADGQTIRLKGQGMPGPRGPAGDALITVTIAEHPLFKRDGANLRLELPVTLYEAVLGGKVRVPTLDGAVELAIPAGTSSGRTLRVKGKGLPGKDGAGDLYATVRIVLPEGGDRRARGADEEVARRQALRSAPRHELSGRALRRRRDALLELVVGGAGDGLELVLVLRAADHPAVAALDPVHGAETVFGVIAKRRPRRRRAASSRS